MNVALIIIDALKEIIRSKASPLLTLGANCFTLVNKEHKVNYIFTHSEYYTRR